MLSTIQIKKKKVYSINGKRLKTAILQDAVLYVQEYKSPWRIPYISAM